MPTIPHFLHNLVATPALAMHVRSLELQLESWPSSTPSPPDTESVVPPESVHGIRSEMQGRQLVQLLHLLPRLTYLDLWPVEEPDNFRHLWPVDEQNDGGVLTQFHALLTAPTTLPAGLQNLREFRSVRDMGIAVTTALLIAVMALPSIRIIAVTIDDSNDDPARTQPVLALAEAAAGSSGVTDLQLLYSDLSQPVLVAVLVIPRALTRFKYRSQCPEWRVDLPPFGASLVSLVPTLQDLRVGFARSEPMHVDDDLHGTIGPLSAWNALETFESPILALLGRFPEGKMSLLDILPRRLHTLRVVHDPFWSTQEVEGLVVDLLESGEMVALREIGYIFAPRVEIQESALVRLRRACEDVGVAFVVQREEREVSYAQFYNCREFWCE